MYELFHHDSLASFGLDGNLRIREGMVPLAKRLGGYVLEQSSTRASKEDDGDDFSSATLLNHAEIPPEADLTNLSLEEVLEVAGAQVQECGPFNTVCEEAGIYQLWTQEFVHHLGDYLWERHQTFQQQSTRQPTMILDIGAGDGLLTHYLEEYLEKSKRIKKGRHNKSKASPPISLSSSSIPLNPKRLATLFTLAETLLLYPLCFRPKG